MKILLDPTFQIVLQIVTGVVLLWTSIELYICKRRNRR